MQKSLLALFTGKVLASCGEGNQASGRMHSSLTTGGAPNKMFDRNILTVQEGTMQFVQMFDRLECCITNIHIFTLPVRQKLAQICPLYNGVFFLLILIKLFL